MWDSCLTVSTDVIIRSECYGVILLIVFKTLIYGCGNGFTLFFDTDN